MAKTGWPEAANRRLRAMLWQRWPIAEMALRMDRTVGDIETQMRRLGLAAPRGR
jgi:hypothetical protein